MTYAIWDKLSTKYDNLWVQKYSLHPTREKVLEILDKITTETCFQVLDIGCGTGQLIMELADKYPLADFVGIDKSPCMISLAREKNPGCVFYVAEAEKLNIKDIKSEKPNAESGQFDFITCCHSFPYYADKKNAAQNISNLVRTGGYAIFVQASANNIYDRLVMWFVEKTAEAAQYLSKGQFKSLFSGDFDLIEEFTIKEKWYMPTICGFVFRRK